METITSLYDFFTECGQVTTDSRNCPEGSMFIALKGGNFNGNAFAEQALQKAIYLFGSIVPAIKNLRIDEANAQMIVITYSNRKGFADSFDAMLARLNRHISMALKQKIYGIVSSDSRRQDLVDLENIKS